MHKIQALLKTLCSVGVVIALHACTNKSSTPDHSFKELAEGMYTIYDGVSKQCGTENTSTTCANANKVFVAIKYKRLGNCFDANKAPDKTCIKKIANELEVKYDE